MLTHDGPKAAHKDQAHDLRGCMFLIVDNRVSDTIPDSLEEHVWGHTAFDSYRFGVSQGIRKMTERNA